ncbi:MAG: ATP-binding protein [Nitrospira sp.]|nr:ATP-binding protein [Nitrospira sp.]
MHLEQTLHQMRTMRLATMATCLEQRLKNGDHRDLSHEEFISLLVEDEFASRKHRRLSRMIGKANFKPQQACVENIHYDVSRGFAKKDIMQLTSKTWIDNCQHLIITGPTGTGKTYIAEAIGLYACKMGYPARKIRYTRLFEEIQAAKGTGVYLNYLRKLQNIKVLIIDDFAMQPVTPDQLCDLMEIIEERDQLGPVIITTQYPPSKWHSLFDDPTIADAICDRLIPVAIKLNLKGKSLRGKKEKIDK